jgi:hypothetical protein
MDRDYIYNIILIFWIVSINRNNDDDKDFEVCEKSKNGLPSIIYIYHYNRSNTQGIYKPHHINKSSQRCPSAATIAIIQGTGQLSSSFALARGQYPSTISK